MELRKKLPFGKKKKYYHQSFSIKRLVIKIKLKTRIIKFLKYKAMERK